MQENFHRNAARIAPQLRSTSYEVRREALDLSTVDGRRIGGDMMTLKFQGHDDVNTDQFYKVKRKSRTRYTSLNKRKRQEDMRKDLSDKRVAGTWNELS